MLRCQISVAEQSDVISRYLYYAVHHIHANRQECQNHITTSQTVYIHTVEHTLVSVTLKKRAHAIAFQRQGDSMPLAYQLHQFRYESAIGQNQILLTCLWHIIAASSSGRQCMVYTGMYEITFPIV